MIKKEFYVEEKVTLYLLEIGIPANLQGFRFLRQAVTIVVNEPSILEYVTKRLYPTIAKIYSVTTSVVERSIRHAVEVAIDRKGVIGLNELFGIEVYDFNYKPSSSEIIALLTEKLFLEMRKEGYFGNFEDESSAQGEDETKNDKKDDINNQINDKVDKNT